MPLGICSEFHQLTHDRHHTPERLYVYMCHMSVTSHTHTHTHTLKLSCTAAHCHRCLFVHTVYTHIWGHPLFRSLTHTYVHTHHKEILNTRVHPQIHTHLHTVPHTHT